MDKYSPLKQGSSDALTRFAPQVIAGLIAGGSFAEMSDFMPGVKMLLQVAQQQVTQYLREEFGFSLVKHFSLSQGVYVEYQQ